ncbi:MAG: TIGR03663 family protein [Anaerolineales bacterium]|nr:TIGR03663 family protein [Anaerolineales bacterium]
MEENESKHQPFLSKKISEVIPFNWDTFLFLLITIAASFTRFFLLGARVMSHDENTHVYFSWLFSRGSVYGHDPLSHGPFQFHLVALAYRLFGDSDLTARMPAALFGIAAVLFIWKFKTYLGKWGTYIAAGLMTISPFMVYYSRYVRNEAFVMFFGVVTLWATLRYLETGKNQYLYALVAVTALHFTTKETSFLYLAELLIFLGLLFLVRVNKLPWKIPSYQKYFSFLLVLTLVLAGVSLGATFFQPDVASTTVEETAMDGPVVDKSVPESHNLLSLGLLAGSGAAFLSAFGVLIFGFGQDELRKERTFSAILLLFSIVLPHLAALPVYLLGWDPLDYTSPQLYKNLLFFALPLFTLSFLSGLWWNIKQWLINNVIFYAIFGIFYTTFFTHPIGFVSGLMGSLGYWLEQQGVERGGQPWYYYALVEIPFYEFLTVVGFLLAVIIVLYTILKKDAPFFSIIENQETGLVTPETSRGLAVLLLIYWSISSQVTFAFAGEKMPWLSVHIALPMLLLSGWAIGWVVERVRWKKIVKAKAWPGLIFGTVLLIGLWMSLQEFLGNGFLDAGYYSSTLWFRIVGLVTMVLGISYFAKKLPFRQNLLLTVLMVFGFLGMITLRSSVLANYQNYDDPTEYLVYAHSSSGIKRVLTQVEDISLRMTDGKDLMVAYDNDTSYPMWWYLRDYSLRNEYGGSPTSSLRDYPVILVGRNNYSKVEPIVRNNYFEFEYTRIWWPNQDYWNPEIYIFPNLQDPVISGPFIKSMLQIWLNRDYSLYGSITGKEMTLENWSPSEPMKLYIRKDVANQVWDYGSLDYTFSEDDILLDAFEGLEAKMTLLKAEDQAFQAPRDIAIAPDGTLYIADSRNHRIVHLSEDGSTVLNNWGTLNEDGNAPGGTFFEPWGIAVADDGAVFVADTWHHRIQKFTPDGKFITMWGIFDLSEDPAAFWGPRDIEIDSLGRLLVSDTGNKRIRMYSQDGEYLGEFGSAGIGSGEFDEPVGLAFNPSTGLLFVADTWNQRVEVFQLDEITGMYFYVNEWSIYGWFGESLENKPYLDTDTNGKVYVTDPEAGRIMVFDSQGTALYFWQNPMEMSSGVAIGEGGTIWVSDGSLNQVFEYDLPDDIKYIE